MGEVDQSLDFFEDWFSCLRDVFKQSFISPRVNVNSVVILAKIKNIDIDKSLITSKIKDLKEDYWSPEYFITILNEFDEIVGISDDFLKSNAVTELSISDLKELKWDLMNDLMIDYSKFTKEFYDSLKYSQSTNLKVNKHRLMIAIMDALNIVHDGSKELTQKYSNKRFNNSSYKKFISSRLAMEHIMLRIYFIMLNINNKDKLLLYRRILIHELNEYIIQSAR